MTIQKRGLGRGLDVLIKSRVVESDSGTEVTALDIDSLRPNAHQPRQYFDQSALEELASSIKAQGLLQPVLVRPLDAPGQFEIVAGERRWRASRIAGIREIPCLVRKMDEGESMTIALIENLQREDLHPLEEARALSQIKDRLSLTQEDLADKIGKSRSAVANSLRLLKLPERVLQLLEENSISAGHGRALLSLEDHEQMSVLASMIVSKSLSVRETEAMIKKMKLGQITPKTPPGRPQAEDIAALLNNLSQEFTVQHRGTAQKGKIVFTYKNDAEREKIAFLLARMSREHAQ